MSINNRQEKSEDSSEKTQRKTSSTSFTVEGGDQEIASLISDFNSPTIKADIVQWLESIRTFPKPFKFTLAPITDLLKFSAHALFPDEETDWGCEAYSRNLKLDPDSGEAYYEITINGTKTKKYCEYMNRDELMTSIEKRRRSLEKAIRVYMEEVMAITILFISLIRTLGSVPLQNPQELCNKYLLLMHYLVCTIVWEGSQCSYIV